jgi:protein-disulfide isomerase
VRYVSNVQYPPPNPYYGGYAPVPPPKPGGISPLLVVLGVGLLFLFTGIVGGAIFWIRHRSTTAAASGPKWSDLDSPVPVSSDDPMRGDREAPVTIVVFEDFQCPFCKRLESTLDDVRAHYGPSKVRIIWKNEPLSFHMQARPAAEAGRGVFVLGGNEAFWKFHDSAYANQTMLDTAHYETWAKLAGVDGKKVRSGLTAHTWATKIDDDHVLATSLHVSGTPDAFVNGIEISGAQPLSKFESVIDDELKEAAALVAKGTPKTRVYVERSKANYAPSGVGTTKPLATVTPPDDTTVVKVPIGTSPVQGPATALVTIVEFSDFQCPYCSKVQPTLARIKTEYPGQVRIVWKNEPLPFHPTAEPSAELALEAQAEKGDATFWAVHDALFADQTHQSNADLLALGRRFGLDSSKVSSALSKKTWASSIAADQALATAVGAEGTPTFLINGRKLVGAQPFEKFKILIDAEILAAKAELAKGTAPTSLYDALTARGKVQ